MSSSYDVPNNSDPESAPDDYLLLFTASDVLL
jgi:hypothetical protein